MSKHIEFDDLVGPHTIERVMVFDPRTLKSFEDSTRGRDRDGDLGQLSIEPEQITVPDHRFCIAKRTVEPIGGYRLHLTGDDGDHLAFIAFADAAWTLMIHNDHGHVTYALPYTNAEARR